jgi:hypothetical protein
MKTRKVNDLSKMKAFSADVGIETFEFLQKPSKSSFLRKQESIPFKVLWIPAGVYPVLDTGRE